MKVVLDTNVLIAAILWKGETHKLISLIDNGEMLPCFSPETCEESLGVLGRSKFEKLFKENKLAIRKTIIKLFLLAEFFTLPKSRLKVIIEDPTDDKFLLLAQVAKAKYLVSGDKHLRKLKRFGTTKIISVSEFLYLLDTSG